MRDYSWVRGENFDDAVARLAHQEGVGYILSLPGVWEIVSEEFNNAALELLEAERGEEDDPE